MDFRDCFVDERPSGATNENVRMNSTGATDEIMRVLFPSGLARGFLGPSRSRRWPCGRRRRVGGGLGHDDAVWQRRAKHVSVIMSAACSPRQQHGPATVPEPATVLQQPPTAPRPGENDAQARPKKTRMFFRGTPGRIKYRT